VLNSEGGLNPKFPGGAAAQKRKLAAEGHKIMPAKGKKPPVVMGFEKVSGQILTQHAKHNIQLT